MAVRMNRRCEGIANGTTMNETVNWFAQTECFSEASTRRSVVFNTSFKSRHVHLLLLRRSSFSGRTRAA